MKTLSCEFQAYLKNSYDQLLSLTYALCAVPAPSHHEEARAAFCLKWLEENGLQGAFIDKALNVVWPYRLDEHDRMLVMMAHTDTVFPDAEPFAVKVEGDRAFCPGIGDDTVNVAMLMLLMRYVSRTAPRTECGLLFVLNSCEEGLGNLKGVRQIFADYGSRVREFITLDGDCDVIVNQAVGSTRYRISLDTEGGHSFGAFGNRNAIERMARLVSRLYDVKMPERPGAKTTYNVGVISGGTSVNTIAQHAEMLYEYRSSSRECLEEMKRSFEAIIEKTRPECLRLEVEVLGERPCAAEIDPAAGQALLSRAQEAIQTVAHLDASLRSGSTDCNIPLSLGIPAICFGASTGKGAHTYQEYIDLTRLPAAYEIVARTLNTYFID